MSCPQEQLSEGSDYRLLVPSGESEHTSIVPLPAHELCVKQQAYQNARKLRREQWAISDAEDFCVRKEVEPGTYKPLWWSER